MGPPESAFPVLPPTFRRMSPAAIATSALLHALIALALLSALPPLPTRAKPETVEISVDLAAAQPAAPSASASQPATERSTVEPDRPTTPDLPSPPPLPTDAPTQFAPSPPVTAAPEIATRTTEPARPAPVPTGPDQPSAAAAAAPSPAPPQPTLEQVLPPLDTPPAPSARDFAGTGPRTAPPPAAAQAPKPQAPVPKPTATPSQRAETRASPSPQSEMTDDANRRQAREDYLWQVIRKLSQQRFQSKSREPSEQGVVVTRLTLARDGRLLDVALARSSGFPDLDRGVMETVRQASPFAPLPPDIAADRFTILVPISYVHER